MLHLRKDCEIILKQATTTTNWKTYVCVVKQTNEMREWSGSA